MASEVPAIALGGQQRQHHSHGHSHSSSSRSGHRHRSSHRSSHKSSRSKGSSRSKSQSSKRRHRHRHRHRHDHDHGGDSVPQSDSKGQEGWSPAMTPLASPITSQYTKRSSARSSRLGKSASGSALDSARRTQALRTVFRDKLDYSTRTEERSSHRLAKEGNAAGNSRVLLAGAQHCLGYTGHVPGKLGLGQEVYQETNVVLDSLLNKLTNNLTSIIHPVPMVRGPQKDMSTTAKDVAVAGAQRSEFLVGNTPRVIDNEYFRIDSEFTQYTDACLRQNLDPLNTGH